MITAFKGGKELKGCEELKAYLCPPCCRNKVNYVTTHPFAVNEGQGRVRSISRKGLQKEAAPDLG